MLLDVVELKHVVESKRAECAGTTQGVVGAVGCLHSAADGVLKLGRREDACLRAEVEIWVGPGLGLGLGLSLGLGRAEGGGGPREPGRKRECLGRVLECNPLIWGWILFVS